ncbi:DUF4407 domain-containing protein [Microbacterium sp. cx-55]|uniref:DUF4407 domain-containing protein n=1 Tax=Microbacterium sp. cx-55 TaxID=2875948 RepID=UPI001CBB35D4|nr:DUF4407 domain-containing protein [Microbacterium sp. cx-55]MBZ4488257.1 DUF4407 domain-containing protein [Microbacterium sp. cx-55]UGB34917.1 DUF4407 domain-containing protein [Microbacterium sp. cx-55]
MSFSAHRPGEFGSDGRFTVPAQAEGDPLYLSDVRGDAPAVDDAAAADAGPEPEAAPAVGDTAVTDTAAEPETPANAVTDPPANDATPAERPPRSRGPRSPRSRRRLPWSRRLAVLGGAENDVLDDVPTETPRFVQMFFVLAGTALVSALSMLFALVSGVRISPWIAVVLAIVWALIIFNLDRFLTSTMRSTRNVWRLIGLAFPRVIMAALIGIVVAEPLVLQIFQNDIAREVTSTNVSQALSDQDAVTSGPEKQALDAASARVSALENQAATGIVAGTSSTSAESVAAQQTVDQLTAQLAERQTVIDQARALYQCELTGEGAGTVPGCTGVQGSGASSDAAQAQLAQAQTSYDDLAAQLQQATAALTAANAAGTDAAANSAAQNTQQAEDELPAARAQYDAALAAYNERAAAVADTNAGAQGILSQITALERLSQREPVLAWAHWLIAALFFMIELLPVLVKVLTSFGDPSLYEKADALRRQVALDRVTARTWRERAAIVTKV